jgi:hypothetical protein
MRAYETEVYFMAKNRDVLGVANVIGPSYIQSRRSGCLGI